MFNCRSTQAGRWAANAFHGACSKAAVNLSVFSPARRLLGLDQASIGSESKRRIGWFIRNRRGLPFAVAPAICCPLCLAAD